MSRSKAKERAPVKLPEDVLLPPSKPKHPSAAELAIMEKTDLFKETAAIVGNQKYYKKAAKLILDTLTAYDKAHGEGLNRRQSLIYYEYARYKTPEKIWELANKLEEYDTELISRSDFKAMLDESKAAT